MRSHTVAAEGGSAGVVQPHDSLDAHFNDTVSGGDWLCEQNVVEYFVAHCTEEMVQLEHWGCPWSRKPDGHINVRAFGGMKIERTWFAADKSGFHILHTLFQTSTRYPAIHRLDEYFCVDLIVEDGRCQGVVAIEMRPASSSSSRPRRSSWQPAAPAACTCRTPTPGSLRSVQRENRCCANPCEAAEPRGARGPGWRMSPGSLAYGVGRAGKSRKRRTGQHSPGPA
jgi:hypothetical protein